MRPVLFAFQEKQNEYKEKQQKLYVTLRNFSCTPIFNDGRSSGSILSYPFFTLLSRLELMKRRYSTSQPFCVDSIAAALPSVSGITAANIR